MEIKAEGLDPNPTDQFCQDVQWQNGTIIWVSAGLYPANHHTLISSGLPCHLTKRRDIVLEDSKEWKNRL